MVDTELGLVYLLIYLLICSANATNADDWLLTLLGVAMLFAMLKCPN